MKPEGLSSRYGDESYGNQLINRLADAVIVTDLEGAFLYGNKALERQTGYANEEFGIPAVIRGIYHPDDSGIVRGAIDAFLRSGEETSPSFEFRLRTKSGAWCWLSGKTSRVDYRGTAALETVCRDINDRKRIQGELKRSRLRNDALLDAIPDLMFMFSSDGRVIDYHAERLSDLYIPPEAFLGKTIEESFPPELVSVTREMTDRIFAGSAMEYYTYTLDLGGPRVFESRLVPCGSRECLAIVRDITKRTETEKELKLAKTTIDEAPFGVFWIRPDGRIVRANEMASAMLGYSREELLSLAVPDIHVSHGHGEREGFWDELKRRERLVFEIEFVRKDGTRFPVELRAKYLEHSGEEFEVAMAIDVSGFKEAQGRLESLVDEKSVLMKELQHRVKNNLSLVSSLLGMEMEKLADDTSRAALRGAQDRIQSMSAIYEQLYRTDTMDSIDLRGYLESLAISLFRSYMPDGGRVRLELDLSELTLDLKRSIPIGLILNELVTNALKYAFPGTAPGVLRVGMNPGGDGLVTIVVSDTGAGFDPENPVRENAGIGLELVMLLSKQIRGTLLYERNLGMTVSLSFRP